MIIDNGPPRPGIPINRDLLVVIYAFTIPLFWPLLSIFEPRAPLMSAAVIDFERERKRRRRE